MFSSIDHRGRYAFGNQPDIARWNLARLAETLLPLLSDDPEEAVAHGHRGHRCVPGAVSQAPARADSAPSSGCVEPNRTTTAPMPRWSNDWLTLLHAERVDFTLAWRRLADAAAGDEAPLRALFADARAPDAWLARWRARCAARRQRRHGSPAGGIERADAMRRVNPYVIARNHRVEEALAAASDDDDLAPFERLLDALRRPYDETPELRPTPSRRQPR